MHLVNLHVPQGWRLTTLGEVTVVDNQLRKPISATERKKIQGEYRYYGPTKVVDYIDHYQVEGTYALIAEDGDHFLKFRTHDMTQLASGKFNVNNHAHLVRGTSICTTEWVFNFYRRANLYPFITRQGAGRFKLNKKALLELPILLPPLEEQNQIADILSTWDEAIRLTEALIGAKERRKRGLMQVLLTGKVRFPEFARSEERVQTKIGEFPAEWPLISLKELAIIITKGTTPTTYGHAYVTEGVNFIPIESITKSGLFLSEKFKFISSDTHNYLKRSQLKQGDLLFSIAGALGRVGTVSQAQIPANTNQALAIIRLKKKWERLSDFIVYCLRSQFTKQHIKRITSQSAQPNVNLGDLGKFVIPLPSTSEAQKIASLLTLCDEEINLLRQKAAALRTQKKGLMQQLLTGNIRVTASPTEENDTTA